MIPTQGKHPLLVPMALLALAFNLSSAQAEETPLVTAETRLAFTGDSITEWGIYTRYVEAYLIACLPTPPAAVAQFGAGGEQSRGFARRITEDCLLYKPTLLTTCYGINDAFDPNSAEIYRTGMTGILDRAKEAGATVLVAGPGAVDTARFKKDISAADFNERLRVMSDVARELADERGFPFVDMHALCMDVQTRAKADHGEDLVVFGGDGIHPGANGGFAMAYAFLAGMGFDGAIGTIALDLAGGETKAEASEAHTVEVKGPGRVSVVSARWPFCVSGGAGGRQTTEAILPYLPFSEKLNRFTLVVNNLGADQAEVNWGGAKKTFSREELERGVNLADAFAGKTPFQSAWKSLEDAVGKKQEFERKWYKELRGKVNEAKKQHAGQGADALKAATDAVVAELMAEQQKQAGEAAKAFKPVTHLLEVKAL